MALQLTDARIVRNSDSYEIAEEYYDRLLIEMRNLDAVEPDTSCTILGRKYSTPIMTGGFCLLDDFRPNGTAEMARGMTDAGALMSLGFTKNEEYDAAVGEGQTPIRFIKPYRDHDRIVQEIQYTAAHQGLAVGIDIAHGLGRTGQKDLDANRLDMYREFGPITSDDLQKFVAASTLPFIAKDVLSVTDALKCKEAGCAGIVVGHHHNICSYCVPPLMILQDIRKAVGPDMFIIVDGIYTGSDAFKALALGADAVMAGRALTGSDFIKDGHLAVARRIREMTGELAGYMGHTACATIQDIESSIIHVKY